MSNGFQQVLDHIRSIADSEFEKGRLFERLMKTYFTQDPLYRDRFSEVWLWSEWAALRADFDGKDTGIDLVAEEREGGYCAIQCKCYAPGTRISKSHLDSFISASAREPFTARIVVDTGDEWGPTAVKTIAPLKTACSVIRFGVIWRAVHSISNRYKTILLRFFIPFYKGSMGSSTFLNYHLTWLLKNSIKCGATAFEDSTIDKVERMQH